MDNKKDVRLLYKLALIFIIFLDIYGIVYTTKFIEIYINPETITIESLLALLILLILTITLTFMIGRIIRFLYITKER